VFFVDKNGDLTNRYDIQKNLLAQLIKPLPYGFSVTAQYQSIRNSSHTAVYDYDKDLFEGILTWAYY